MDYRALGENTIAIDCDVLQADGGTRTAAITGAYVALADAIATGRQRGWVKPGAKVLTDSVSAVSVGVVDGEPRLDLHYDDDVRAEVDSQRGRDGLGRFRRGPGHRRRARTFDRALLDALLELAAAGCGTLAGWQADALAAAPVSPRRLVLATRNAGKLAELYRILVDGGLGRGRCWAGRCVRRVCRTPPRPGTTFADNALIKARDVVAATGLPAAADDSGLCRGRAQRDARACCPARWSGRHGDDEANLDLVLGQLGDVPDERRGASFVCAAALVCRTAPRVVEHGELAGGGSCAPRAGPAVSGTTRSSCRTGSSAPRPSSRPAEKDAISHRGRAFRALLPHLRRLG